MEESDTILKLRQQLRDTEEERVQAAKHGLQLLENQTELQNQLEEQRIEMTTTIAKLEQERYSLQREVELKKRMLESLGAEYENLKEQQTLYQKNLKEQLARNHDHEMRSIKDQWEKVKTDLDETRLSEKQLKKKLDHQLELVAQKTEEIRVLSERAYETMSSEMIDLQLEVQQLEMTKATLEEEVYDLKYRLEQLENSNCNLNRQLERIQNEKEEREKEVVSYCRALEKARDANQELQIQLDQALHQAQDPNSKGNSLFSEVEDRRAEMERQLIGIKVQHQSLKKQYEFTRQQMHRMKVQIATLLQMKGSQTDPEQLERLQAMVAQKNNEIEKLLIRERQLEKCQNQEPESTSNDQITGTDSSDETYYVDLLKMKLESSNKEIEKLKDDLSLQRMKALAESQRVLELEKKLFTNERQHKLFQCENMKLRIRLDELKMKYEPDEVTKLRTLKRNQEILPVDTIPVDVKREDVSVLETYFNLPETVKKNGHARGSGEKRIGTSAEQNKSAGAPVHLLIPKEEDKDTDMPLKERKRVRIMDDQSDAKVLIDSNRCENSKTSASPRSATAADSREQAKKSKEEGITVKRHEKATRQRAYQVIHVPSKPTAGTQCPQQ